MIALGTYLKQYKVGDIVDVVANGAVQKGMVCQYPVCDPVVDITQAALCCIFSLQTDLL